MGCNFYTLKNKHIGKRSAAGLYCWDCGVSLYREDGEYFAICPSCGAKPTKESLNNSAAGRELGFNKSPFKKKTGVQSCSSFSWAIEKRKLKTIKKLKTSMTECISIEEFHKMLKECPIQYYHNIGREFS